MSGSGGGKPAGACAPRTAKGMATRERLIERELGKVWAGTDRGETVGNERVFLIISLLIGLTAACGFVWYLK